MQAIMRICTYVTLPILAGMATGRVIKPPNPVKKPDVPHFITCHFASAKAASSGEFVFDA